MTKLLFLVLLLLPSGAAAQLEFCAPGSMCWTNANPTFKTNVKFSSEDVNVTLTVLPGITSVAFAPLFAQSQSPWICGQIQHVFPDGKVSPWYISDREGVCNLLSAVLPAMPPMPPIIEKPGEVGGVRIAGRVGTQVNLVWEAVTGATTYTVKVVTAKGLTLLLKDIPGTAALVNLPTTGRRLYVVCASNAAGETCPAKLTGAFATR